MNLAVSLPLLLLLILTAAGAIYVKDLIGAVFILGSYSFFLALLWSWQGAADVAFTEAVVGAGLSTIFFLLALFQTTSEETNASHYRTSFITLASLGALGVLMAYGAQDLPIIGDPTSPPNTHISPIYLERSLQDTRTPNVVTSVLMDYRSLDTLVETAVIFTSGVAATLLLKRKKR